MAVLTDFLKFPAVSLDIETSSLSGIKKDNLNFLKCFPTCISLYWEGNTYSINPETIPDMQILGQLLSSGIKLIGHNLSFDLKVLACKLQIPLPKIWGDSYIAGRYLNEHSYCGLQELSETILEDGHPKWEYGLSWEELSRRCEIHAKHSAQLLERQLIELKKQKLIVIYNTTMSVYNKMTESEYRGVTIDTTFLLTLEHKFNRISTRLHKRLLEYIKHSGINGITKEKKQKGQVIDLIIPTEEINLNSSKDLIGLIFGKMGYARVPTHFTKDKVTRRKSTTPSTDYWTLLDLSEEGFRLADFLLLYRHWNGLKTKVNTLIQENVDGRIYTSYDVVGTDTYRFTDKVPNLQQVPSKTVESKLIRKCFIGDLLVIDYSNIELRLLAHWSGDANLIRIYNENRNLHLETASKIFRVPVDEVTPEQKSKAKTINFGIVFGIQEKSLAKQLRCSIEEAREYIKIWYNSYPAVIPWKNRLIDEYVRNGYVTSYLGVRHRIDFSKVKRWMPRRDGYGYVQTYEWEALSRIAVNRPIQGTSATITKLAIEALKDENIVLQVHDEIVIDKPKRTEQEIQQIMEEEIFKVHGAFRVPIKVELKRCKNWSEK